jgi:hypothetical protein
MCRRVQVNAVAPGVIGDSGTHRYAKEVVEGAIEKIPLKRHGKAVEVAYLATFLASPMASYITGQVYALPPANCFYHHHLAHSCNPHRLAMADIALMVASLCGAIYSIHTQWLVCDIPDVRYPFHLFLPENTTSSTSASPKLENKKKYKCWKTGKMILAGNTNRGRNRIEYKED